MKFLKYFATYFFIEFIMSTISGIIIVFLHTGFNNFLHSLPILFFYMFTQLLMRNILGNYYFSWRLMTLLLRKNIPNWINATVNSTCIIGIFFFLRYLFDMESDFDNMIFNYLVGLPILIGVVASSFIMVNRIENYKNT